jgi:hypothetical protein
MQPSHKYLLATVFVFATYFIGSVSKGEPSADPVPETVKAEKPELKIALKPVLFYSLGEDNFQGGRTFDMKFAAILLKGKLDDHFYYFLQADMSGEPNLLDAYIGYKHSEKLRIQAGAQKPKQTLDYLPDPVYTDFVSYSKITGLLVQSREIGVSAEGNSNGLFYFLGIFNGSGLIKNNNNKFYSIGRVQYTFNLPQSGFLTLGLHGSYGDSPGIRTGTYGPKLRGERTISGTDLRMEAGRWLLAAEYTSGLVAIVDLPDTNETISGYFLTAGYRALKKTQILGRYQSWSYKELNSLANQITLGINHKFTKNTGLQFNFDSYMPDGGDAKSGFSMALKVSI